VDENSLFRIQSLIKYHSSYYNTMKISKNLYKIYRIITIYVIHMIDWSFSFRTREKRDRLLEKRLEEDIWVESVSWTTRVNFENDFNWLTITLYKTIFTLWYLIKKKKSSLNSWYFSTLQFQFFFHILYIVNEYWGIVNECPRRVL
jgi:hypothetical protein